MKSDIASAQKRWSTRIVKGNDYFLMLASHDVYSHNEHCMICDHINNNHVL